jgi:hypothetical protein
MTIGQLIEKIGNLQQYKPCINHDSGFPWAGMEESTKDGFIFAADLKNILEEFLTGLTLEAIETVINSPNKNKPKIEPKLLPGKDLG